MQLAAFDLDNTLLNGDSDYLWGRYICDQGVVDAAEFRRRNDAFHAQYLNGTLDIHAFQRFALQPLIENPLTTMQTLRTRYVADCIEPVVAPGTPALIDCHRRRGDTLLIITATNRFITEPIAELLGVEHLLATDPEFVDGRYTGRIQGTPCFRDGKITRLEDWLAAHGPFEGITAYSDSHNDIPLLARADRAAAVDPDDRLAEHARQQGWPVVSLVDQPGAEVFRTVTGAG